MTEKTNTPESSKDESVKECGCKHNEEDVPQQTQSDIDSTTSKAPLPKDADGDVKKQATGKVGEKTSDKMSKDKPSKKDDDDDDEEDEKKETVEQKLLSKFAELEKKIDTMTPAKTESKPVSETGSKKPTALIATNKESVVDWESLGKQAHASIKEHGHFAFDVALEPLLKENLQKTYNYANPYFNKTGAITETFSTSGTIPGVDLDRDFLLLPGGTYMKPIRQYTRFKVVPQGMDRERFFTSTIPASATQTHGSQPSDSTYTLTAVEIVPNTITGHVNTIYTDNLEDFPVDLMKATTQAAIARMMDFEADQTFDVAAAAATPGEWIKGSDGTVITQDDTASVTFTAAAIAEARKFLEMKGYPVDRLVCALAPQQYKELATDSNIVRYIQANPGVAANISTTGIIERYLGVELLVTNKVKYAANTTNHALRAIVFVKNWTFGMAVKRDLTIKMHEYPEDNEIIVTANWRVASTVLDATSFVQISSTTTQAGQSS
ncbi:MAG: hypothetical protein KGI08_04995 [Thaumarchaeota archaeon]|nr:hypothetical protein [Nitrososphaerota archaeon]